MMREETGIVLDIQRFSLHDGPGIRTTVFLKGCPLRCAWCHNPESWEREPQIFHKADGTKRLCGRQMTVLQVMEEVCADHLYYETSGGGMTVSGGEPMAQLPFLKALLTQAREQGIPTCIETSGFAAPQSFREILPLTDLFLFDIKAVSPELHRKYTGGDNTGILENLDLLCHAGARVLLRCPIIPGINDTDEQIAGIAKLANSYSQIQGVQIMPYHDLGVEKWRELGYPYTLSDLKTMEDAERDILLQRFQQAGCLNAAISGR